ncbi:MAG: choice-of-anchor L domain-containing protein [Myxococcota bacterium]
MQSKSEGLWESARWVAAAMVLAGCAPTERGSAFDQATDGTPDATSTSGGGAEGSDASDGGIADEDSGGVKLDVSVPDSGVGDDCSDPDAPDCECVVELHPPCDDGTDDPFAAMGIGCGGGTVVSAESTGSPAAIGVRSGLGGTEAWAPTEGKRFAVIGSGNVAQLDSEPPTYADPFDLEFELDFPSFCSDDLDGLDEGSGPLDPGTVPAPIVAAPAGGVDCLEDPTLVGLGDCSNSLQGQLDQGTSVNDYTELRVELVVPNDATSLSYDFAFFSTEYPAYLGSTYNDLFVGWIESEAWTGNVSFDAQGNPISLNAAFFDLQDDNGETAELAGTCMRYHGATRWLTSTTAVNPGETVELVLAVFDLSDSILDSYVFVDNVRWGCEGTVRPGTTPVG